VASKPAEIFKVAVNVGVPSEGAIVIETLLGRLYGETLTLKEVGTEIETDTVEPALYQCEPGAGLVEPPSGSVTEITSSYSVAKVIDWPVWEGTFMEPEAGEAAYLTPEPPETGVETVQL